MTNWRIDDLAQRAGIAVDTIRYYQREGLLPTGERAGRTRLYGPEHLERLERIRALQSRRFSLAAIRALLDRGVPGELERLLAGSDDAAYDYDELVEAAGVPPELARDLIAAGLLREPADHGRAAYDGEDLNVLRYFADLRRLAIPDTVLVEMARLFASNLDAIQRGLSALFNPDSDKGWDSESYAMFKQLAGEYPSRVANDMRVISDYVQHRNLQRLLLLSIEHYDAPSASDASAAAG